MVKPSCPVILPSIDFSKVLRRKCYLFRVSYVSARKFPSRLGPSCPVRFGLDRLLPCPSQSSSCTECGARCFFQLNPRYLVTNPVMFVAEVAAAFNTAFLLRDLLTRSGQRAFEFQAAFWLWLTVLFATFAEALADASGRARAKEMRESRTNVLAKRIGRDGKLDCRRFPAPERGSCIGRSGRPHTG